MRMKKLIISNWKMNGTIDLMEQFLDFGQSDNFILALPSPLIALCKSLNNEIKIAAQDCSIFAGTGSYTGEVSAELLKKYGADYVIIGHSERRAHLNESSRIINSKIKNAIAANLTTIYCVSESYESQIKCDLIDIHDYSKIIFAYEPVSAIGTGNVPSISEISSVTKNIKLQTNAVVLYGGSVSSKNISEILEIEYVGGVLVGGASLKHNEVNAMLLQTP